MFGYESSLRNKLNTLYDVLQDGSLEEDERAELEDELADLELDASDW